MKGARSDLQFVYCDSASLFFSTIWSHRFQLSSYLGSKERRFAKLSTKKSELSQSYASSPWQEDVRHVFFRERNTSRILMWAVTLGPVTDSSPSASMKQTPQCKYCTWIGFVYMWRNEMYMILTVNTLSVVLSGNIRASCWLLKIKKY